MRIVYSLIWTENYRVINPTVSTYGEAIQGKPIMLLPVSEGRMNLKTTDINRLIETLGVQSLSGGK